jgi:hypothetical protein
VPRFFKLLPSAEREGRALQPRSSTILAFVGIFLLWWILTAFVYRHTQSNFLRAESGWYLFVSHSTPAVQHGFEKTLLTKSFNGHYAPFARVAEFATARLVGTHAGFWKWRQITVLGVLATMVFLFARNSGCALQLTRLRANLGAVGLTAILIFQVQMRDFIAWPFMIMQLFWLLCTVMALLSLIQMVRRPAEILWPWLAAGAAYGSLHFLGLGMATVAATTAVLAGILLETRHRAPSEASKIPVPLLSMIALTALHAVLTLKFLWPPATAPSPPWPPASFLLASLHFIPNFLFATLCSLFSTGQLISSAEHGPRDWPYGLATLLGFGFLVSSTYLRSWREPTARNRARFILHTFASVSFLTITALIVTREWQEPAPNGFANYFTGARYLIPSTFALAGVMSEVLFLLASAPILLNAILSAGLAVCAIIGNLEYAANVYPKVKPRSMISHASAWQSVVSMARECRSADLAIPNVPLGALTQEFGDWDLRLFEPLLRADLKLPAGTSLQFVAWNETPDGYYRDVPSLFAVRKKLQLETRK